MVALAQGSQSQGIGRRAVEHEIDIAIGLEQLPQMFADPLCPFVVAVTRLMTTGVGLQKPMHGLRTDACVVVTGEMLARGVLGGRGDKAAHERNLWVRKESADSLKDQAFMLGKSDDRILDLSKT
jgi:hypothetical protein